MLLGLLMLAAWATPGEGADGGRFALTILAGNEAAREIGTAREAFPAYRQMAAAEESQGRFREACIGYRNAAAAAASLSRRQDALDLSQKAVEMGQKGGSQYELGHARAALGRAYLSVKDAPKAIQQFELALGHVRGSSRWLFEVSLHRALGQAYRQSGRLDLAQDHIQKAIALYEDKTARQGPQRGMSVQAWRNLENRQQAYVTTLRELGWLHILQAP